MWILGIRTRRGQSRGIVLLRRIRIGIAIRTRAWSSRWLSTSRIKLNNKRKQWLNNPTWSRWSKKKNISPKFSHGEPLASLWRISMSDKALTANLPSSKIGWLDQGAEAMRRNCSDWGLTRLYRRPFSSSSDFCSFRFFFLRSHTIFFFRRLSELLYASWTTLTSFMNFSFCDLSLEILKVWFRHSDSFSLTSRFRVLLFVNILLVRSSLTHSLYSILF